MNPGVEGLSLITSFFLLTSSLLSLSQNGSQAVVPEQAKSASPGKL